MVDVTDPEMETMNELALFSGAGGGILGGKLLGWQTVCAVELDPYCREVLLRRQEEGHLSPFPIWDDIRTFDGKPWRGKVDVVSGGFPCQPFSVAGQQQGESDARNMWPDTLRMLCEVRPRFAFLENVPGLMASGYFTTILRDLAACGFDAEWGMLSAAEVGAGHIRKRLWILANAIRPNRKPGTRRRGVWQGDKELADTQRVREPQPQGGVRDERRRFGDDCSSVADTDGQRQPDVQGGETNAELNRIGTAGCAGWWDTEPDVGRVADGVAYRVDRLRAIGNGQVPRVAAEAWKQLTQ